MTTAIQGAVIPVREEPGDIKVTTTIEERSKWRYVWFPGDTIKSEVKFSQLDKRFGGLHRQQFRTLRYDGNDGMIYRCAITALKPGMRTINKAMLSKEAIGGWLTGFTLVKGEYSPQQKKWIDVQVPREVGGMDYLLYQSVYPGDEILQLLSQHKPNGESGVVEFTPLIGATPEERDRVQLFFFPNWLNIQKGIEELPETITDLENHIKSRLRAAKDTLEGAEILKHQTIGQQMLAGCQKYRTWGMDYVKYQDEQRTFLTKKGAPYSYPELCETLMDQLGMVRKDDMASVGQNATSELAGTIAEQNRIAQEQNKEQNEIKQRELDLKERAIAIQEAKLGIGKPVVAKPVVAEPQKDTQIIEPACSKPRTNGQPCKAKVIKEVDGKPVCAFHSESE